MISRWIEVSEPNECIVYLVLNPYPKPDTITLDRSPPLKKDSNM